MDYIKDWVTFIIPTLGRYTVHRTLKSLRDQSNKNWKAIVVFDNHIITIPQEDKIAVYEFTEPKRGAGIVRNFAIDKVDTEYIAFVDDDDWVDKNYVNRILHYGKKGYELISFTYKDVENGNTQPPPWMNTIVRCNIGISFAVKTEFVHQHGIQFIPGGIEDYEFINDCVKAGANWVITHEILYWVGHRSAWGEN